MEKCKAKGRKMKNRRRKMEVEGKKGRRLETKGKVKRKMEHKGRNNGRRRKNGSRRQINGEGKEKKI